MAPIRNAAVALAYKTGTYEDANGIRWRQGLDGWFDDSIPGHIRLIHHQDFAWMVEEENPDSTRAGV